MKKDNFVSKYTWISLFFPCAVAVKRDINCYLFLFILDLIEIG